MNARRRLGTGFDRNASKSRVRLHLLGSVTARQMAAQCQSMVDLVCIGIIQLVLQRQEPGLGHFAHAIQKWIRVWYPLLIGNQKDFQIDGHFTSPIKVHLQLGHLTRDIVEIHVAEDLILFALVSAMEKKYFLVARTRNDATVLVSFHFKAEHSKNRKHHKPCLIDFGTN